MRIKTISADELFDDPDFPALAAEYLEEMGMPELVSGASLRREHYAERHKQGMHFLAAYLDGRLAGFFTFIYGESGHYGKMLLITESYFVGKEFRKSGAGLRLLSAASEMARDFGAEGIIISASAGSRLDEVLPKSGYRVAYRSYFKSV